MTDAEMYLREAEWVAKENLKWFQDANWAVLWFGAGFILAMMFKKIFGTQEESKSAMFWLTVIFPPFFIIPIGASILWHLFGRYNEPEE